VGLAVLGLGDPAAAIVGRTFGRHRLADGRSLEGTAAFVVAGSAAAWLVLTSWHPEVPVAATALAAAGGGAAGELVARRIDDNLVIPIAAAFAAWVTSVVY
jgi:dolichol kinase